MRLKKADKLLNIQKRTIKHTSANNLKCRRPFLFLSTQITEQLAYPKIHFSLKFNSEKVATKLNWLAIIRSTKLKHSMQYN